MRRQITKSLYFCVLMSIAVLSCVTEGPDDYKNYFIKYYGGDGNQEAKDFVVNADGTVIILGTSIETTELKQLYLVKTDIQGNIIWEKKFGSPTDEAGQDIEHIIAGPDAGNFIVLSNVTKSVADSVAIRLTVISSDGDSLKSFLINRYESQIGKSITPLSDGTYFLSGKVPNADTLNVDLSVFDIEDVLVVRISNTLTPIDYFRIGGSGFGSAIKIFEGNGANYYYAGYSDELIGEPNAPSNYELNFVFRIFTSDPGAVTSDYRGDDSKNEQMSFIAKSNVGYLAVGTLVDVNSNSLVAVRTNSNFGNISAMQNVIADMEGVSAAPINNSNMFWVLGNEIKAGGRNIWVGKVDDNLNVEFSTNFGASNNDDTGSAIAELPNGDVLILGTMELVNQKKIVLIKIKPNGTF